MPADAPGRLILVGRVSGAFGVKGEVRISSYTAEPMAILSYGAWLREDGTPAPRLLGGRPGKGPDVLARIEGVADKDAADALRGVRLYVPRDALPSSEDEDDFYLTDLIGLAAVDAQGRPLGRIKAVHDFGAGDVLEVDPGEGRATWLLAFTRDNVPEVNLAAGRIVLARPPEVNGDQP